MFQYKQLAKTMFLILAAALLVSITAGAAADEQTVTAIVNPFIEKDKLLASDKQTDAHFGAATVLTPDGQYMVVGAPLHDVNSNSAQGQVYIYQNDGENHWTEMQKLTASDGLAGDRFGQSLAIAPNYTLIIGAPEDDEGSSSNLGSAYIFTFNAGTWSEQQKLEATDSFSFSGDERGTAVALTADGDTAFIGAPGVERSGGTIPGVVYVFERSGETWNQTDTLVGPTSSAASFGRGLATSGDGTVLVVGGLYRPGPSGSILYGRAYVYEEVGGNWTESQVLTPSETAELDDFASDMALNNNGSVMLIGASHQSSSASSGKAYLFTENAGNWSEQQRLTPPSGSGFGHYGAAVAVDSSGDYLAIGAWLNTTGGVHRYERSGSTWVYKQTLTTADERQEQLGYAVALSANGEILVSGARSAHTNSSVFDAVGAVYTFSEGNFIYLPTLIR